MPRYLRYLRIAFSVTCGIACVLLVVLWVRSYWWADFVYIELTKTRAVEFGSVKGSLVFVELGVQRNPPLPPIRLRSVGYNVEPHWKYFGFQIDAERSGTFVSLPHWFAMLVTAIPAVAFGRRLSYPRYSLKSLLIGTTVIAVVLGLIMWAIR
jgi:hypothetical protein